MVGVAGMLLGIALGRLAGPRTPWLRAAILAQTADLVTFSVLWDYGQGELNPLGRISMQLALGLLGGDHAISVLIAGVALMSVKLALIAYLVHGSPFFGPYRQIVLAVATAIGIVGALSNVIAYPNTLVALIVVAAFALIAARWPSRFGDAVGMAVRLVIFAGFALSALAVFAYLPYIDGRFVCGTGACPPLLGQLLQMLAVNLVVSTLIAFWIFLRFVGRFSPWRLVRAA